MSRTVHLSLDVRGAITGTAWKWVSSPDGKRVTRAEAIEYLMDELAKGHLFLPIGRPCDGFNYQAGGCPGHPSPLPGGNAADENGKV